MNPNPLKVASLNDRPQAVSKDAVVAEVTATVSKQIKAHTTREISATEERLYTRLIERTASEGYDKGKLAGIEIGEANARAGRTWTSLAIALVAAGCGVLGTMYVYEKTTMFGVAIGRGEVGNEDIRRELNEKVAPQ